LRPRVDRVTLTNFRTIRDLSGFEPGSLTVLIGPNGAGKSNFLSFFRLLSGMMTSPGQLQEYVVKLGGISALLHDGPEKSSWLEARIHMTTSRGPEDYSFDLAHASGDQPYFSLESFRRWKQGDLAGPKATIAVGHRESWLVRAAEEGELIAKAIRDTLRGIAFHQFHNTSETARIRQRWDAEDGRYLKEDAGNIAPFLLRMQSQQPRYYHRIVETVRLILPFFEDFELWADSGSVLLHWREKGTDRIFHAGQAADGVLRIFALVALLEQPEADLPDVLILDEPELGLHPYAIEVIAGLIRAASRHVQILIATQSVSLIDHFDINDIVVVDRHGRESTFRRLGEDEFKEWLDQYTLSELWEKNVIGGRP
jgi:predicted ATPase